MLYLCCVLGGEQEGVQGAEEAGPEEPAGAGQEPGQAGNTGRVQYYTLLLC